MGDITAALQQLRALLDGAERAGQRVFLRRLNPILDDVENELDNLVSRALDHIEHLNQLQEL